MPYLGTDKHSPAELQQEFYKLGLGFGVFSGEDHVYVSISGLEESADYGARLIKECREGLSTVLPFTDSEQAFLDLLLDRGVIDSAILTVDISLQKRIQCQPLLEWKALNVRRHKGLS